MMFTKKTIRAEVEVEDRLIEYEAELMLGWAGDEQDQLFVQEIESLTVNIVVFNPYGDEMGEYSLDLAPDVEQRLFNAYVDEDLTTRIVDTTPADYEWRSEEH